MEPTIERKKSQHASRCYNIRGEDAHKLPPKPDFLGEKPVLKPEGSEVVPAIQKASDTLGLGR